MVEREPEHAVARLEHGEVDGHVRLRAGVRLHVRVLGAEELRRAVARELLDLVDDLAAAVVALARVALGVLVRRHRADRLEHARPGEVLGGDQLDLAALAVELAAEQLGDLGVDLGEPGGRGAARTSAARRPSPSMRTGLAGRRGAHARDRLGRGRCAFAEDARLGAGEVEHRRRRCPAAAPRRARRRSPPGSARARRRASPGPARPDRSRSSQRRSRRRRGHAAASPASSRHPHADRVGPLAGQPAGSAAPGSGGRA